MSLINIISSYISQLVYEKILKFCVSLWILEVSILFKKLFLQHPLYNPQYINQNAKNEESISVLLSPPPPPSPPVSNACLFYPYSKTKAYLIDSRAANCTVCSIIFCFLCLRSHLTRTKFCPLMRNCVFGFSACITKKCVLLIHSRSWDVTYNKVIIYIEININ